jgi:hypothetical protein
MVNNNRSDYRSEWAAFTAISKLFAYVPGRHSGPGFAGLPSMLELAPELPPMSELDSSNWSVRIRTCAGQRPY